MSQPPPPLLLLTLLLLLLLPGSQGQAAAKTKPKVGDFMPPPRSVARQLSAVTVRRSAAVAGRLQLSCDAPGRFFAWRREFRVVGDRRLLELNATDDKAALGSFHCYTCESGCSRLLAREYFVIDLPVNASNVFATDMKHGESWLHCRLNVSQPRWEMYDQTQGRMVATDFNGEPLSRQVFGRRSKGLRVTRQMFHDRGLTRPEVTYFRCLAPGGSASFDFQVNARFSPWRQVGYGRNRTIEYNLAAAPAATDEAAVSQGLPRGSIMQLKCEHSLLGNKQPTWALRRPSEEEFSSDLPPDIFRREGNKLIVDFFNATTTGIYRCSFRADGLDIVLYKPLHLVNHGTVLRSADCQMRNSEDSICCEIPTGSMQTNLTWRITSKWAQQEGPLVLRPGEADHTFTAGAVSLSQMMCLYYRPQRMHHGYFVECLADGFTGSGRCLLTHPQIVG